MSNDRLDTRKVRTAHRSDTVDLVQVSLSMLKIFKRTWFWMCLLWVVVSFGFIKYKQYDKDNNYKSYVTFAFSQESGYIVDDELLATRVANSFNYLLDIDNYYGKLCGNILGIARDKLTMRLQASRVPDTNFVTITATAKDMVQAKEGINLIIDDIRSMVHVITGNFAYDVVERYLPEDGMLSEEEEQLQSVKSIIMGVAAGLIAVLGVLFTIAVLSDAVRGYDDIRSHLDVNRIGEIPTIRGRMSSSTGEQGVLFINHNLPHSYRDSIYLGLARIEKSMREKDMRTILITSSIPQEGKTTISCNLALAMAERGDKVLLIDADLRNPSVASGLGIKDVSTSVSDILKGKATMREAIVSFGERRPDLLLGREGVSGTDDLLTSYRMSELIKEARNQYDYVIVDTPPAAMLMDASIIAGYVDAAAYIVRQDYTRVRSIEEGVKLLESSGVDVLGCIINCADGMAGYGYGYGYGYGGKKSRRH